MMIWYGNKMTHLKSYYSLIFLISAKNWPENSRSNKEALRNQVYTWKHFRNNLWVEFNILAADLHLSIFLYSKHRCNIWLFDRLGACKSKCVAHIRIWIPRLAQRYEKSLHEKKRKATNVIELFLFAHIGRYGFLLPASFIVPNAVEIIDGLKAMTKKAKSLNLL